MIASCLQGVLFLLPGLLLALLLRLRRRPPGERLILALHRRRTRARRAAARGSLGTRVRSLPAHPRGGRLIASSLAGRAPPLAPIAA